MNKKGFFTSSIYVLAGLFILVLILTSLLGIENGIESDNIIKSIEQSQNKSLNFYKISEDNSVIINVLHSFLGFILYSSFEITKVAIEYSVEHPYFINAKNMLRLVILFILMPIIYYLFLICIVIFLLIREWCLNKKEKNLRMKI